MIQDLEEKQHERPAPTWVSVAGVVAALSILLGPSVKQALDDIVRGAAGYFDGVLGIGTPNMNLRVIILCFFLGACGREGALWFYRKVGAR